MSRAAGRIGLRVAACLASGLWLCASLPPLGLTLLAWIALVPFLLVTAGVGIRVGLGLGALFGLFAALPQGAWLSAVVQDAFGASLWGGLGLWLAASLAFVPAYAVVGAAVGASRLRSGRLPLVAALAWGLAELSHLELFPRIPWSVFGASQIETPVAPLATWFGVYAVSVWVVFVNALLAQLLARAPWRPLALNAVAGLTLLGLVYVAEARPSGGAESSLRIAAIQPAVPMPSAATGAQDARRLDVLLQLSARAPEADLVIWPESSLDASLAGRPDLAARIQARVDELGVPVLLGGFEFEPNRRRNQLLLFEPGLPPRVVYEKRRPLVLAEAVPGWLPVRARRALGRLIPSLPQLPGRDPDAGLSDLGSPELSICYEAILSGFAQDPQAGLLLNLVNDGWYDRTPAARLHLQLARWRALESGAPLVRVASTGISAHVDPRGRLVQSLPVGEAGVLAGVVPISTRVTPFERFGYLPLYLAALALAVSVLLVPER